MIKDVQRVRESGMERVSVHVVQLMLAILSLGSLTAAITAVGNLAFLFLQPHTANRYLIHYILTTH